MAGVPPEEPIQRATVQGGAADIEVERDVSHIDRFTVGALVELQRPLIEGAGDPKPPVVGFVPCAIKGGSSDGDRVHEPVTEHAEEIVEPTWQDGRWSNHAAIAVVATVACQTEKV
jgi:hypothetical protein